MSLKASTTTIDRVLHLTAIDAIDTGKPLDQLWKIADAAQLAFRECIGNEEQQDSLIATICLLDGAISKQSQTRPSIPNGADGALREEEQQELAQLMAGIEAGIEE